MTRIVKFSLWSLGWAFSVLLSAVMSGMLTAAYFEEEIRTRSLVIMDDERHARVTIRTTDAGPELAFLSEQGRNRISMQLGSTAKEYAHRAGIYVHSETGEPLVSLAVLGETATVAAMNSGAHASAALIADKSLARLGIDNHDGTEFVAINTKSHSPGITIYDKKREFTWRSPIE